MNASDTHTADTHTADNNAVDANAAIAAPDATATAVAMARAIDPAPAVDPAPAEPAAAEPIVPAPHAIDRPWVRLLASLAQQPTRTAALQQLAEQLREPFPDSKLRVARGGEKLRDVYDAQIGRVGVESSLYHDLAVLWPRLINAGGGIDHVNGHRLPAKDRDADSDDGVMLHVEGHHFLILPTAGSLRRVVIWQPSDANPAAQPFQQLHSLAGPLAIVLASRPLVAVGKAGSWLQGIRSRFMLLALVGLAVLALIPVSYRVRCTAMLEPVHQRIIAAPFDATLLDCHVRPGDRVRRDQVLLTLDGRPLQMEREALLAERAQAEKKHAVALASGQIADAQLANLHTHQLQHQIDLLERRLGQLLVRSPIEGIVVSGDLHRSIGSPTETGQPLLEVAPLDEMLVEVAIPESDILYVQAGAKSHVRLSALPTSMLSGQIESLDPAAEIRDHENVFVGRWTLQNPDDQLRPGMRGYATVYGPRRPLAWKPLRQLTETLFRSIGW